MNIYLHIERLVVDELPFSGKDTRLLGQSLEAELTRLLKTGNTPEPWRKGLALSNVAGGEIRMAKDSGEKDVGAALARVVHRRLYGVDAARLSERGDLRQGRSMQRKRRSGNE